MGFTQKKVTRKELLKEPDQFISFSGRLIAFGRRHRNRLLYATVAVLALMVAFTAVRYFTARAENKAFALLDAYTAQYRQHLSADGPQAAWQAVHDGFESLIDDYGGRTGGQLARIRYGGICYAAGRFEEAVVHYRQALADFEQEPFYRALVLSGLGYAHRQKHDWAEAAECFGRVVETPGAPLRDKALFVLAGVHAAQGDTDAAQAAYRRLLEEFPASNYAPVARERMTS